jgi:hypothetical protein
LTLKLDPILQLPTMKLETDERMQEGVELLEDW